MNGGREGEGVSVSCAYCIALIFRRSKFLQIAVLKGFVEKILRMHVAHAHGSAGAQILAE